MTSRSSACSARGAWEKFTKRNNSARRAALKILAPWLAADEDALRRFWREAAVPAQLDHPGIVRIIATGKTDGIAYYAMQMVRGLTLAQIIQKAGVPAEARQAPGEPTKPEVVRDSTPSDARPTPVAIEPWGDPELTILRRYRDDRFGVVLEVGLQAARALAAAHRQGVVHRDIKPSNLMVDQHEHLYVVDFGLTRAIWGEGAGTRPGGMCGTPWYMSPEQARGESASPCTDLYSLGVTLYELASGGLGPFTASRQSSSAVLEQVRGGAALPLRVLAPEVPSALERVISRTMHFNPRKRYASAEELVNDLEALDQPGRTTPSFGRPRRRRARARFAASAMLAVVAVLTIVLLAGALARGRWPVRAGPDEPGPDNAAKREERPPAPGPGLRDHLPLPLRQRLDNHRVDLLKRNSEPVWGKRLFGTGGFLLMQPQGLNVMAQLDEPYNLIALDDPGRRSFEFTIDVQLIRAAPDTPPHEVGAFFGWRPGAPCYFVHIAGPAVADATTGRLLVAARLFEERRGAKKEFIGHYALPGLAKPPPLPPVGPDGWRRLRIRALNDKVRISVDRQPLVEFDVRQHRALLGEDGPELSPHGALGIWAHQGGGFFRSAFTTTLPANGN